MGTLYGCHFGFGRRLSRNVYSTHQLLWGHIDVEFFSSLSGVTSRRCGSACNNHCNLLCIWCFAQEKFEEVNAFDCGSLDSKHRYWCVLVPSNARVAAVDAWNVVDVWVEDWIAPSSNGLKKTKLEDVENLCR
jgi:hypothetical protein